MFPTPYTTIYLPAYLRAYIHLFKGVTPYPFHRCAAVGGVAAPVVADAVEDGDGDGGGGRSAEGGGVAVWRHARCVSV